MEKKILCVIQSNNFIYGAGRSFRTAMNNLQKPFDLIVPKALYGDKSEDHIEAEIRKYFNSNLEKIYIEYLPYAMCFYGKKSIRITGRIYIFLKNLLYQIKKHRLKKIFKNYSCIYINSLVLYPLLGMTNKGVIHIREKLDINFFQKQPIKKKLQAAQKVIFISYDTKASLSELGIDGVILNNPFDMTAVNAVDIKVAKKKYGISENDTVFAVLGKTYAIRGVDFIAKTFSLLREKKCKLLIVGDLDTELGNMLHRISKSDSRIILTGEQKDVYEIYAISDYIVRGESVFSVGRTIYEGLYSGCRVIAPGDYKKDSKKIMEYQNFKEQIIFYKPRDAKSFFEVLSVAAKSKVVDNKVGKSNLATFSKSFNQILEND